MLALKYLLTILGTGLFSAAAGIVLYDIYRAAQLRRLLSEASGEASGGGTLQGLTPRVARSAPISLSDSPSRPAGTSNGVVTRPVFAGSSGWVDATIIRRSELVRGDHLAGPAVIEEPDSTTYVPAGFAAIVHESRCLIVEDSERRR